MFQILFVSEFVFQSLSVFQKLISVSELISVPMAKCELHGLVSSMFKCDP